MRVGGGDSLGQLPWWQSQTCARHGPPPAKLCANCVGRTPLPSLSLFFLLFLSALPLLTHTHSLTHTQPHRERNTSQFPLQKEEPAPRFELGLVESESTVITATLHRRISEIEMYEGFLRALRIHTHNHKHTRTERHTQTHRHTDKHTQRHTHRHRHT
jgi:hypothetical protein